MAETTPTKSAYVVILDKMDEVLREVSSAREEIQQERQRRRLSIALGAIAIVFVLILAMWNHQIARDVEANVVRDDRTALEDRLQECESRNATRASIRNAMEILINALVNNRTDSEILDRANRLKAQLDAELVANNCQEKINAQDAN